MGIKFSSVKKGLEVLLKDKDIVPMIVGHAGIGKTQLVQSVARDNGYKFAEITCSLINEGDIVLPYPGEHEGEKEVKYMINDTIKRLNEYCKEHKDDIAILFLDEFNRATIQVQSELMNLILQRNIMGIPLEDNLRIVTASNPSSDMEGFEDSMYATNEGDAAINDRTVRLRMDADVEDWLENYAKEIVTEDGETRIHGIITNYLEEDGRQFFLVVDDSKDKNPTPRGYERLSKIFRLFEDEGVNINQDLGDNEYGAFILESIKGVLGDQVGSNLFNYILSRRDFIKPMEFIAEDGETLSQSMQERIDKMGEVRKKINMVALINYLTLKKNTNLLKGEKGLRLAKRMTEFFNKLDNDVKFVLISKLVRDEDDNDFTDKEVLKDVLFEVKEFEDEAFEVVARTTQMG